MAARRLAAVDWGPNGIMLQALDEGEGRSSIWTLNPDAVDPVPEKLLDFRGAVFGLALSPQRKEALFSGRLADTWSIYTVTIGGKTVTQVAPEATGEIWPPPHPLVAHHIAAQATRARWSPDGNQFVYGHRGRIYVANRDGTDLADVTPAGMVAGAPAWSLDGKRIAFHADDSADERKTRFSWDIWVMGQDGANVQRVTSDAAQDMCPEWAP